MNTTITRDEWLTAMGNAVKDCNPDAKTTPELAEMFGISRCITQRRMRELVRTGRAKSTWKMIMQSNGYPKRVTAYLLVRDEARPATRKR